MQNLYTQNSGADLRFFFGILLLLVSGVLILIYGFHGTGWHTAARYISLACLVFGIYFTFTGHKRRKLLRRPLRLKKNPLLKG